MTTLSCTDAFVIVANDPMAVLYIPIILEPALCQPRAVLLEPDIKYPTSSQPRAILW